MNKKIIGLAAAAFVGVCAAQSLLALRKALQEKAVAEAAAAEAEDEAEPEAEGSEVGDSEPAEEAEG